MTGSLKRFLFRHRSIYRVLHASKSAGLRVWHTILGWLARIGLTGARLERAAVFGITAVVLLAFLYAAWLLKDLFSGRLVSQPLALAFGFLAAEVAAITIQVALSCALKDWATKTKRKKTALFESIQSHMAAHALGEDRLRSLRKLRRANFAAVEECLENQLAALEGKARHRLSRLASRLGYRGHWEAMAFSTVAQKRRRASHALGLLDGNDSRAVLFHLAGDKDPLVQAAACHAIARRGSIQDCEAVFQIGLQGPLVVRMVLATALRPHCIDMANGVLDRELRGADRGRTIAGLNLAQAWKATLQPETLLPLLMHAGEEVRAAALRMLPFQPLIQPDLWVAIGLGHANPSIRTAAAETAGQLGLSFAAGAVAGCARQEDLPLAHRSLLALAAMGGHGEEEIETILRDGERPLAALALEALALAKLRPEVAQRTPFAPTTDSETPKVTAVGAGTGSVAA